MGMRPSGINSRSIGPVVVALSLSFAISALSFASTSQRSKAKIEKREFGKLADGTSVDLYTLTNKNGIEVQITNYGGAGVFIRKPNTSGKRADNVLGYDQTPG